MKNYQICKKCIMDTTDPDITFDKHGVCNHCHHYEQTINKKKYLSKRKSDALQNLVKRIKKDGKNKKYDCIIGISGGVDSTYVAYLSKKLGLRALAVHLNNGYNTKLSEENIKNSINKLKIDFYDYKINLKEFYDLQLSFLKASTPDIEIPTDHAIIAVLYEVASKNNIKYILSGHNTATECGGVASWSQGHYDWKYIKSIQKKFGRMRLKTFPHFGILKFIYHNLIKKIKRISILDYVDYEKNKVLNIIEKELNWQPYEGKHNESIYTRFLQEYIFPKKFGFSKKRLHLSSLIWSGQETRESAIKKMLNNDYPKLLQEQDKMYISKNLGISEKELDKIIELPPKSFSNYPSYKKIFYKHKWIISIYHKLRN